jgi:4-amino-4-deoxy-L-arabinose transferase-like glycosyltransferase
MATPKRDDSTGGTGSLSDRALSDNRISAIPISRHELAVAVLVTLVGFGLRVAFPSRMAVEHFDEGVYASNLFFDASQGFRFPNQHLYAPPLLPWLIEWVFILFGPSNVGAMIPSIIAGSLTVPLMWWVGRRWFGPTAGLAAAILCATNDIHILFSRSALTDVLLCFWLLLAVYLFWEAITRNHLGWAIAAGVATSLAWWTKYSGWLPLAITSAGLALSWLLDRRTRAGWKRHLVCWLITAGVAALLWLPWLWSLQTRGGYSAVRDNHRGYLVGWNGWWESLSAHVSNGVQLEGSVTALGMILAFVLAWLGTYEQNDCRFTWNKVHSAKMWPGLTGLVVVMVSVLVVSISFFFRLVILVQWVGYLASRRPQPTVNNVARTAAVSIVSVCFLGLVIVTPLYTPYPRLALPWHTFTWLAMAYVLQNEKLINHEPRKATAAFGRTAVESLMIVVVLMVLAEWLVAAQISALQTLAGLKPRQQIQFVARDAVADVSRYESLAAKTGSDQMAFYVYGEPALVFQLRLAGVELVRPVEHLAFARVGEPLSPVPIFLLTGPHAERNPNFARQFEEGKSRLKLVKEYEYHPSDLVWRDERREFDAPPTFHVKLYRLE